VNLGDDEAEELIADDGPAWKLWDLLRWIKPRPQDRNLLGPATAGQLLARKRPLLIPVCDSHVKKVLSRPWNELTWWSDLRCQLTQDDALVSELEAVRARAGAGHLPCCGPLTSCAGCLRGARKKWAVPTKRKPDRRPPGHGCRP
jgi:hypothetical protein